MSGELTTVETGEIVATLSESEKTIKAISRDMERAQRRAVEGMEEARQLTVNGERDQAAELVVIRSARTFEEKGYRSFTAYTEDGPKNVGLSKPRIFQLLRAHSVITNSDVITENPRQAFEIARVPEPLRDQVVAETIEVEGKLTARGIRETAERITNPQPPDDAPDGALLVAVASACSAALADGWTPGEIRQVVLDAIGEVTA